jgi:hypothetical protein
MFEPLHPHPSQAEASYCAPYLHLLEDQEAEPVISGRNFNERKLDTVQRHIRAGCGQGRGEHYQPWIRITRRFSSPVSHMVLASLGIHRRSHHLLSKLEHHTALQLAYLGAVELRECLPMWPTPHPHPWLEDVAEVEGLLNLAADAGIDHGTFVGTNVPYVGSLDMLVAIPRHGRVLHLGVSCKPDAIYEASLRAQERVELDRLYCQRIGATHVREGGWSFSTVLLANLQAYRPRQAEIVRHRDDAQLADFCGEFSVRQDHLPLSDAINGAGNATGLSAPVAARFWRLGIWLHRIDIDMGQPVCMTRPARRGSDRVLAGLTRHFLGDLA